MNKETTTTATEESEDKPEAPRMMRRCPACLCAVSPKRAKWMTYEVDGKAYTDPYHARCVELVQRRLAEGVVDDQDS